MTKNSKRKLLLITVFLMTLFISSTYTALIPNVHAAAMSIQEKGLAILSNVVGLGLAKYNVTAQETQATQQASYLDVVPQEIVLYNLNSESSRLKVSYTFANGKVQLIHVLENEGTPSLTKTATNANAVEMAKDFLSNYQTYTENPLFGELKNTLDKVDQGTNITKTSGNIALEVKAYTDQTIFKWYYTSNSAIAPYSKAIALGFKDGFLKAFVDNWQLYNVGSTTVNLSEEEAKAIALETAEVHFYGKLEPDALDIKNFNDSNIKWTSFIFDCSLRANKARSEDPLELYPVWRVGIALNKWYGNMYGVQVDIWADTKEVRSVQEAWSTLPPPEDVPTANVNSQASAVSEAKPKLVMIVALPTLAIATAGTALVWMRRKKKTHYYNLLRPRVLKAGGTLLCLLISSMILLASIATVNATTRAGVVWGSESTGAGEYPESWRKYYIEVEWQRSAGNLIASNFANNGYDGYNNQGSHGTTSEKSAILSEISNLQNNHDYLAVVYFDHGVGGDPGYPALPNEFHYMVEDNRGTWYDGEWHTNTAGVYDLEIFQQTQPDKIIFAFINTCESADLDGQGWLDEGWPHYPGRARGMTYAWTHHRPGIDMSIDGYSSPDTGSQVYIGFPWGSASLMQDIPYESGSFEYFYWVNWFFYVALNNDISVNQALDSASWNFYYSDFGSSPLKTGFTAFWWPDMEGDGSTMAVYGNGNIHLQQYEPDYVTTPSLSGPTTGYTGISYEFNASSIDPSGHDIRYIFDWGDGSPQTWTNYHPSNTTVYANHTWTSEGIYSVTVRAQCDNGAWSSWSDPLDINIGNVIVYHWLTVNAYDAYLGEGYPLAPNVWIDGNYVGTAPVSAYLPSGWHTVTVDYVVYDPYWPSYVHLVDFTGDYYDYENNNAYVNLNDASTVNALYTQWW
jgi:hypothetical protein